MLAGFYNLITNGQLEKANEYVERIVPHLSPEDIRMLQNKIKNAAEMAKRIRMKLELTETIYEKIIENKQYK